MRRDLQRISKRYLLLIILIIFATVTVSVPIIPYSPECDDPRTGLSNVGSVWLTPAYRKEFTDGLRVSKISYFAIGGVVLVRVWDWLDGAADVLLNTSAKAMYALVDADWGADPSALPQSVQELVARHTRGDGWIQRDCELMHAVAIEGW